MPIFIGDNHEYFRESAETLDLCLRSLFATIDERHVSVTVINNDSIPGVDQILEPYIVAKKIDRYVRNQTNRGKPDAVAAEIKAVYEPFVTLTDCDVLFRHGWMRRLEEVFLCHPSVGAVSPFPAPNHPFYKTATTWLYGLLHGKVRSGKFVEDSAIDEFLSSIGKPVEHFPVEAKRMQFSLKSNRCTTLIGGGHFVVMLRTAAFRRFDYLPRLAGASNGEQEIDAEPDRQGYQRLSTPEYHVYHLGNSVEPWFGAAVAEIESTPPLELHDDSEMSAIITSGPLLIGRLPMFFRRLAFLPVHALAKYYRGRVR
ncbi:glycosyltransferase family A protein [Stieleria varia]|nr:glycosyltransferase family A protein [Stieleria varia]